MATKTPALENTTTLLHDTGCHENGQGFRRVQVLAVNLLAQPRRKVRLTFERSNSDEQSRYFAQVWTGDAWSEVVRIVGTDPRVTESAGMPTYVCIRFAADSSAIHTVADCEDWTSRVLDMLLAETLDVLA